MSLLHRPCLYLLLHICLLGCSAGDNVFVTMNETTEVFLGDSAQIHCHYHFPKDPLFYWIVTYPSDSREYIYTSYRSEEVVYRDTGYWGRINVTNQHQESVLTIHNVQLSDEREFFCHIYGFPYGNMEASTSLKVFAAPEAPEIKGVTTRITLSPTVNNDEPSEIASCETRNGFPRPNITWYRNGRPLVQTPGLVDMKIIGSESQGLHTIQNTLYYKVDKKDVDASFTCEVIYRVPGSIRTIMSESINITVYYSPTMVELRLESPQGLVKEGDTVELRCLADGNPPPSLIFSKEEEVSKNLTGSSNVLILSSVTRRDSGIYQCHPADSGQSTEVKGEMQLAVHYLDPAVVEPEESVVILIGEDVTVSCNTLSSLKTTTVWYKNGKQVGEGTTLHLRDVTFETTGEYLCVVTVPSLPTLRTSGSVHIIVQEVKLVAVSAAVGSGVITVATILSLLLLLAIVISVLYFLHKKGKITFGNAKKEMNKEATANDDIIVEMTNFTKREDSLLANSVNGDNSGPNDQGDGEALVLE